MPNIDPLASVHPDAELAADVTIGPFAIVEADVVLGEGCQIAARACVKSGTRMGNNNIVYEGAIVGGRPQHLKANGELGLLIIGDGNHFRENATLHRGMEPGKDTVVGNENFLMVSAHVGHDCHIGNNIIMANNAMLGGHVHVADRVFLSGNVAVHQFCRIGTLAMVGGQARVTRDVPPYVTIDGTSSLVVGLNSVGLRRAGFDRETMAEMKAAYRHIYRSGLSFNEMLVTLAERFSAGPAAEFVEFMHGGSRGFVQERRKPRATTLKLHPITEVDSPSELRKAG